jgi:hypothetical protein
MPIDGEVPYDEFINIEICHFNLSKVLIRIGLRAS